jgi:carboxyl-terminal processing protease
MKAFLKVALLCSVVFLVGFVSRDLQRGEAPSKRSLTALIGVTQTDPAVSPERLFRQNYNRILTNYVGKVDAGELKYAGIQGMMASLGDPHTVFLEPREAKQFAEGTRANFFGVGASLDPDPLGARVDTAFEDGPAYRAGLRDGDLITAVDGKSIAGVNLNEVVSRIKGPEGTTVKLTITRSGASQPQVLSIRRARIVAPTVRSRMLADGIGLMQVMSFAEPTAAQFDRELDKLDKAGMKGLIIDVRGNPGGLLETAVEMLSRFFENKVVVRMRMRSGDEQVERTYLGALRTMDYPIAVLIDEFSASASEIFAGVLRDYGRVTLIGQHTYGKASVQNVFPLIDEASAKVTIAKYYLPSSGFIGRVVDEDGSYVSGGLKPNVEVELDLASDLKFAEPTTDNQLRAAIENVKSKF